MEARVGVDGGSATRTFLHHHQSRPQSPPPPQPPPQMSQIGTVPQLLAGGIAGAFSKTCTAPLARLTILFQVQGMHSDVATMSKPCIGREALRIVNEEGFRAFWKGNLVTIAHRLPYSSVSFYAYEQYKTILRSALGLEGHGGSPHADIFVHFIGGGLAGMTAASATYPLDLVRTRLAAQCSRCRTTCSACRTTCRWWKVQRHNMGMSQTRSICRSEGEDKFLAQDYSLGGCKTHRTKGRRRRNQRRRKKIRKLENNEPSS